MISAFISNFAFLIYDYKQARSQSMHQLPYMWNGPKSLNWRGLGEEATGAKQDQAPVKHM